MSNKFALTLILFLTATIISACSNRAVYESMQSRERHECLKLPPAEYDNCMARADTSYDEYDQQRKEAMQDDK